MDPDPTVKIQMDTPLRENRIRNILDLNFDKTIVKNVKYLKYSHFYLTFGQIICKKSLKDFERILNPIPVVHTKSMVGSEKPLPNKKNI